MTRPRKTLALLLAFASLGAVSPGSLAQTQALSSDEKALAESVCSSVPKKLLLRIYRGTRLDRSGDVQLLAIEPNFVDGGLTHAGPWDYVQEVPIFWYGPGYIKPGTYERPSTLADIAPTTSALLRFQDFHAPDGTAQTAILDPNRPAPKLVVTLVWDSAGLDVLNTHADAWPYLRSLLPQGAFFTHAVVGSSPSNTPTGHATIGTGAFPMHHGFTDEYIRINGKLQKPNENGPGFLLVPTFADMYDAANDNRPIVGGIATLAAHIVMMSHGSQWGHGDQDIAVTREKESAETAGAEAVTWNLTSDMKPFYDLPEYVNDVPGFDKDIRTLDQQDGALDGYWRDHSIEALSNGFDTPARTPYQTRLVEEVVTREGFGKDDVTDLLFINYKAIDSIGHFFGAESPEMDDTVKIQDRNLKELVDFLNEQVGKGNWVMALTADHGTNFNPEYSGAFQIGIDQLQADIEARFDDSDGVPVIMKIRPTQIWFNRDELAQNGYTLAQVSEFIMGLTQADTVKPNKTVEPGHGGDPVFQAVFPTELMSDMPCLPGAVAES